MTELYLARLAGTRHRAITVNLPILWVPNEHFFVHVDRGVRAIGGPTLAKKSAERETNNSGV